MSSVSDQAAELNRKAWDSMRRQRDAGLVNIRPDSAAAILAGGRFLYAENLELVGDVRGKSLLTWAAATAGDARGWGRAPAQCAGVGNRRLQLEGGAAYAKAGRRVSLGAGRPPPAAGRPAPGRV